MPPRQASGLGKSQHCRHLAQALFEARKTANIPEKAIAEPFDQALAGWPEDDDVPPNHLAAC